MCLLVGKCLRKLKKYLHIYLLFIKTSFMSQMEYRFNFFINIFLNLICLFTRLFYMYLIYKNSRFTNNSNSFYLLLLYTGIACFYSGFYAFFLSDNYCKISEYVKRGTLDLLIVKPLSLQFITTLRYVNIGLSLPDIFLGIIISSIACFKLNLILSASNIFKLIFINISGMLIMYSIFLFPNILSFWTIENNFINNFINSVFELNSLPMKFYKKFLQNIGTFIFPIFLITNFPFMHLLGLLSIKNILIMTLIAILTFTVTKMFWNYGIKNYSSSNC